MIDQKRRRNEGARRKNNAARIARAGDAGVSAARPEAAPATEAGRLQSQKAKDMAGRGGGAIGGVGGGGRGSMAGSGR
jgi:hypothetical protein